MEDYKYCVVKDTTMVIDGSLNSDEVMLQNAINAGFMTEQVEILTQEQYDERKALEPVPEPEPTLEEKFAHLEQENKLLKAQNAALVEQTEFHEEVLTEIILSINS